MSKFKNLLNHVLRGEEAALIAWANIDSLSDKELTHTNAVIEKIISEKSEQLQHAYYLKANMLHRGLGIEQNTAEAIAYYMKALELQRFLSPGEIDKYTPDLSKAISLQCPLVFIELGALYLKYPDRRDLGFQLLQDGIHWADIQHMDLTVGKAYFFQAQAQIKYQSGFMLAIRSYELAKSHGHPEASALLIPMKKKEKLFKNTLSTLRIFEGKIEEFVKKASLETDTSKKEMYYSKAKAVDLISCRYLGIISAIICTDRSIEINGILSDPEYVNALEILDDHSGLKQLAMDIFAAIVTLGTSLIYHAVTGNRFFKINTDSINKLTDFDTEFKSDVSSVAKNT